jgi:predicted DNA-binding transcriptional regulator AlpA
MSITKLLSYNDLVLLGIVNNRAQLSRLQKNIGFPEGFLLSANSRRWFEHEIEEWVDHRSGNFDSLPASVLGDL